MTKDQDNYQASNQEQDEVAEDRETCPILEIKAHVVYKRDLELISRDGVEAHVLALAFNFTLLVEEHCLTPCFVELG